MYNFLSFNTFITQDVLVLFYYTGALLVPFLLYKYKNRLTSSSFLVKLKSKPKILLTILGIFLLLELFWRMMFETMIGYFDMHEYLYHIAQQLKHPLSQ